MKNNNNSFEPYVGSPDNPRTAAVVSYITFIGWLVSVLLLLPGQKTKFSAFHLRQSFLIHVLSFLLKLVYSFTLDANIMVFSLVAAIGVLLFILWLMGFLYAINGQEKEVPIIGGLAQGLFRNWWMW